MNRHYSPEERHQLFPSDDYHSDLASSIREAMNNETECIVGTDYFIIDNQAYGFNPYFEVIFPVGDSCQLLRPIAAPAIGGTIVLQNTTLRTTNCGGLEYWEAHSCRWEHIDLFPSYGDALSPDPSLLNSFNGIELMNEEELFYSYGRPPTLESITQWVNDRKELHAPSVCPLNDCRQLLRRPHALKDHLCFRFDIKAYSCSRAGCDKSFCTKTNCDRHMKDCRAKGNH